MWTRFCGWEYQWYPMVLWLGFGSKIINFSCDSETYRLPSHAGDLSAVLTSGSEVFGKSERFEAPKVDISSINLGVFAVYLALVSPLSSWFTSIWLVSRLPGNHNCCTGIQKGNPGSGWWIYLHPKNHRKTTMFWKISPHFRDIYDFFIDLRMTRYPLTRPQGRIAWCQCLSWSALKSLVVRHPKGYLTLLLLQWQNHAGIWWPVTTNSSLIKIMHLDEPRVATQLLAIALPRRITSTNFGYPAGSIILQLGIHIPMYIHWWQTKKKDPRSKPTIKIPDWSPRPGRDIKSIDRSTH